jgi:hypothetical protein
VKFELIPVTNPIEPILFAPSSSDNAIAGIVVACYENERPLQGWIGKLDWILNGRFTGLVRDGVLASEIGKKQEVVYVPIQWNQKQLHVLILNLGMNSKPGLRINLTDAQNKKLAQKITDLGLKSMIVEGSQLWKMVPTL